MMSIWWGGVKVYDACIINCVQVMRMQVMRMHVMRMHVYDTLIIGTVLVIIITILYVLHKLVCLIQLNWRHG